MEEKNIIFRLRREKGLSQEDLAEKVFVTRQAVSRWENGETVPGTETLKLLSKLFDVSINTLLGSPRQLICQCCGMPLDDASLSKEIDGAFNEDYCKWCYSDGRFTYESMEELIDYLAEHMSDENRPPAQVRTYFEEWLLETLGEMRRAVWRKIRTRYSGPDHRSMARCSFCLNFFLCPRFSPLFSERIGRPET